MEPPASAAMGQATRLMREGRLAEAAALIQRALGHDPPEPAAFAANSGLSRERLEALLSTLKAAGLRQPPGFGVGSLHLKKRWTPERAPATAQPGQFLDRSYACDAGTRRYKLYVPTGYAGAPVPLLVMLHGGTQNAEDFAAGTQMNRLAERHTFLVAYPEQSRSANAMGYWNWFQPEHQSRDGGEPSLIAGITEQIVGGYSIDAGSVYVSGFSAGAAMAAVMAATYPDLYAAVGVHSGLPYGAGVDIPSALAAMKQGARPHPRRPATDVPLIVFHGDSDPTVDKCNADCLVEHWLRAGRNASGARREPRSLHGQVPDGHPYTRVAYHNGGGVTVVEQWTVHQAGHAWSGGSLDGSYTDPQGPDASAEFFRFFRQHNRADS